MKEEANTTPDATLSAGFSRELDAALSRMPERYSQPLVLFHLEGASLDEVARRLDLQPSTLRTRLSRARDMLRQALGRRGVELASVGVLGSLLAAEAKSATFPSSLFGKVLDTATGSGGAASPGIHELAGKATISGSPLSYTASAFIVLMKTKAVIIAATAIEVGAGEFRSRPGRSVRHREREAAFEGLAEHFCRCHGCRWREREGFEGFK